MTTPEGAPPQTAGFPYAVDSAANQAHAQGGRAIWPTQLRRLLIFQWLPVGWLREKMPILVDPDAVIGVSGIGHSCDNAMRTVIGRQISEIGSAALNDRPPMDTLNSAYRAVFGRCVYRLPVHH